MVIVLMHVCVFNDLVDSLCLWYKGRRIGKGRSRGSDTDGAMAAMIDEGLYFSYIA